MLIHQPIRSSPRTVAVALAVVGFMYAGSAAAALIPGQTTTTATSSGGGQFTDCCGATSASVSSGTSSIGSANAAMGSLGVLASVSGCNPPGPWSFQQGCNTATGYAEFKDTMVLHSNLAPGAPLQVEVDFEVHGFVNGYGATNLQAQFNVNNQLRSFAFNVGNGVAAAWNNTPIVGTGFVIFNSSSGSSLGVNLSLSASVSNIYCEAPGSTNLCAASLLNSITLDASNTATVTAHYLTPGATGQILGTTNGHDYTAVPIPATAWLLLSGLASLGLRARRSLGTS